MKHHLKTIFAGALLALCIGPASGQNVDNLPSIVGSAVDKTNDKIIVRDASVSAASGALRKMALAELVNVPGLFSGGAWGSITGTLSAQTDLQAALDAKASVDVMSEIDLINSQPNMAAKVGLWQGASADPVRFGWGGDSYSLGFTTGPLMANSGRFNTAMTTTSGTITGYGNNVNGLRHDYWLNGQASLIPAGAEGMFNCGQPSATYTRGNKFTLYYLKGPSYATSFDLEYESSNAVGTWNLFTTGTNGADGDNVSATNGSTIGAVFTANLPESSSPSFRIRVKNVTGGSLIVVGSGTWFDKGGGVIDYSGMLQEGGVDLTNVITLSSAIYTPILKDMSLDGYFSCWADGATDFQSGGAFRTLLSNMTTAATFTATSGATTSGSATITYGSNTDVKQGMVVSGTGIPTGTRVATILSATSCTLNADATATGTGLTFTFTKKADVVLVSANPALDETGRAATRTAQRAYMAEIKQTYMNGFSMFGSYATGLANGLCSADQTHLTTAGKAFRNNEFWNGVAIGSLPMGAYKVLLNGGVQTVFESRGTANFGNEVVGFNAPIGSTGSTAGIYIEDRSFPNDGLRRWGLVPTSTRQLDIAMGTGTALKLNLAIDGTAAILPGYNNLPLGRVAERFTGYLSGQSTGTVSKTAAYTATVNDRTIFCDATSAAFTITLPAASTSTGREYVIFKTDSSGNAITIDPNASETINGSATTTVMSQYQSYHMQCNGTAWFKIN
jgi:hypothetical protein